MVTLEALFVLLGWFTFSSRWLAMLGLELFIVGEGVFYAVVAILLKDRLRRLGEPFDGGVVVACGVAGASVLMLAFSMILSRGVLMVPLAVIHAVALLGVSALLAVCWRRLRELAWFSSLEQP